MRITKFYDRLPMMECLQGDTLDTFVIEVDDFESLDGYTMKILLASQDYPDITVLSKSCEIVDNTFQVQLTSADTKGLVGIYNMHFCMTDPNNLTYRKLAGILYVRKAVQS